MADGFDIVAVRVDDEGAVIVGVVVRADARRAVVLAAGSQRRRVEGVDLGAVSRGEGVVPAGSGFLLSCSQKSGFSRP